MALVNVPLARSDWRRDYSRAPYLRLRNRFIEANPANPTEEISILTRPSLKRWLNVGQGPNRGLFSEPGSFNGALFVMSGRELYRVSTTGGITLLGGDFFKDDDLQTYASMAVAAAIGNTSEKLFIADGKRLMVYQNETFARGELLATGAIANNDVVELGGVYYQWTNGSVDGGTPAGTSAHPWRVAHTADNRQNLLNLLQAINDTGTAGTTYSTALTPNLAARALSSTADALFVEAIAAGASGNAITTTETGANIAWGAGTLTGGVDDGLSIVDVPEGLAPLSVAFIAGYIIVVTEPRQGFIGRFYWIEPGDTTILPLNFATAESSPDPLVSVRTLGDQFALFGVTTTEMWYPTGDLLAPFARSQGRVFDRGIWVGSDAQIKDTLLVMDTDGIVYRIDGGGPQRISDNSVEERTRKAIKTALTPVAPPASGDPGPLVVNLSLGLAALSESASSGVFPPVAVTISGGVGPYNIRFFWGNQSNGTFGFVGASNQAFAVPQVSAVPNSSMATANLFCSVTDAQGTTVTSGGSAFRFTNLLPAGQPAPPAPAPLGVAVNPEFDFGSGVNQPDFVFGNFSALVSGGAAPYSYQWFFESANFGTFLVSSNTAQTTSVSVLDVLRFNTATASLRCRVTDAAGAVGVSPSVGLSYQNTGSENEVIP